jgi:predicted DNA-binding WGR domain protein
MRIYMQTMPEAVTEAPRFFQITLEQDLLGGWTLYRESGVQGGKTTLKREVYLERDAAQAAFEKARDAQLKKGFKVMFSQGQESAHGR